MSHDGKSVAYKWQFWAAIIVGVLGLVGVVLQIYKPGGSSGHKKYINGVVADASSKAPITGAIVALKTDEGRVLKQDATDGAGVFGLEIPPDLATVRLAASADGYTPYERKLPAESAKNDVLLNHLGYVFGVPHNAPLEGTLQTVAGKMNVAVVFSKDCSKRSKGAVVMGGQVEGNLPETVLSGVLNQVGNIGAQYDVNTIEKGRRYEIRCH